MKIVQHELFPDDTGISKELLLDLLRDGSDLPIKLTITTNRVSMASISFPHNHDAIKVRLHADFLKAPHDVIEALRSYVRTRRKRDWEVISAFAKSIVSGPKRPARRIRKNSAGRVYDLKELRDDVNRSFFNSRVSCGIEWARTRPASRRRRSRSIRYGTWDAEDQTVRISPLLDDSRVPYAFIRYIVFHEMLHAVVPVETRRGRRYYHPPTFRSLERSYPDLKRMHQLAKQLVDVVT